MNRGVSCILTLILSLAVFSFVPDLIYAEAGGYTKWHPGHYALLGKRDRDKDRVEKWLSILPKEFVGIKTGFTWRELEPEKDKYDFSRVEETLMLCKKYNKYFVLQVMERCFGPGIIPLPDYIYNDPEYHGGSAPKAKKDGGQIARLWDKAVIERLNKLMRALGERFNKEPMLEAIIFDETALGVYKKIEIKKGLSAEAYISGLESRLRTTKKAFPNTVVLQYINWLGNGPEMKKLVEYCYEIGAGIGGPDLEPYNRRGIPAYQYYPRYAEKMPLGIDVETPEISGKKGFFTLDEFYDMGVNALKVNYIFWVATENKSYSYSFSLDLIPFIVQKKGKINTGCPENIGPCRTD